MKKVKFQVNKICGGHQIGDVIELQCDEDGSPVSRYWYRRLIDAQTDNCISLIEEHGIKTKKLEEKQ